MTLPNATQGLFKRTHSTVMKRVRGPLVGKASVLNFLTASGAGGTSLEPEGRGDQGRGSKFIWGQKSMGSRRARTH